MYLLRPFKATRYKHSQLNVVVGVGCKDVQGTGRPTNYFTSHLVCPHEPGRSFTPTHTTGIRWKAVISCYSFLWLGLPLFQHLFHCVLPLPLLLLLLCLILKSPWKRRLQFCGRSLSKMEPLSPTVGYKTFEESLWCERDKTKRWRKKQIGKTTQGEENLKCINIFTEIKKKTTSINQYSRFKKGYLEMKEFLKKIFKDDSRIRVNKPTAEIKLNTKKKINKFN